MRITPFILISTISCGLAQEYFDFTDPASAIKGLISLASTVESSAGPYCPSREADEVYQRQIFADFLQTLYGERNVSKAFETHVDPNLIEHDPFDSPGLDAIIARLSQIIPFATYTILSSSFNNNTGLMFMRIEEEDPVGLADIYRMNGTCIVEHWDVSQSKPANATNPIAMF